MITLYSLVQSRYVDIDYVNRWAVCMKGKLPGDQHWLHELEYCQHIDCAESALEQALSNWQIHIGTILPRLLAGFLYLRFLKKEINLHEFEIALVDVVDGYHVDGMDIEYVRMTLPALESNLDCRQLLDGLANESMNYLSELEVLAF